MASSEFTAPCCVLLCTWRPIAAAWLAAGNAFQSGRNHRSPSWPLGSACCKQAQVLVSYLSGAALRRQLLHILISHSPEH